GKPSSTTSAKEFAPAAASDTEPAAARESVEAPAWKAAAPAAPARPPSAPFPWLFAGLAAWCAGSLAIAARLAVGLLRVRRVRRDCERACDDLVLTAGTKPSVYAGHLLGIFRSLSAAAHPVAPAVASERPSHFEGRLRAILDPGASRRELPRGRALLSAAG